MIPADKARRALSIEDVPPRSLAVSPLEALSIGTVRQLLRESGWLFVGQIAAILMSLLATRSLIEILPQATYGEFILLIGFATLVSTLGTAAFSNGTIRFYYEMDRQGRRQELMGTVWGVSVIISMLVAGVIVLALMAFGESHPSLVLAVILLGSGMIGICIGQPVINLTRRRCAFAALRVLYAGLAPMLAAGVAYSTEADLTKILWGYALGNMGVTSLTLWVVSRSGDFALTQLRQASWRMLKQLLSFGAPAVLAALLAWVLSIGDRYLLRYFADSRQVAIYTIGYQAGTFAPAFFSAFFLTIVSPLIMQTYELEQSKVPNMGLWCGLYTCLSLPILVGCFIFPEVILHILTSSTMYAESWRIVPFSACALAFYGFEQVGAYVLHLRQRLILGLAFAALGAAVNMTLNLVLIPRLGYMGAAVSTVVGYLLELIVAVIYTRRLFHWHLAWQWPAIGLTAALVAGAIAQMARILLSRAELGALLWVSAYGIMCLFILSGLVWRARRKIDLRFFVSPLEVNW